MNTHFREHILALVIMGALLLNSCAAYQPALPIGPGQVLNLFQGSVLYGVQQALQGKPGTLLLTDPTGQYFLAAWPSNGARAWAFIAADFESWAGRFHGNISLISTWDELKTTLDAMKWAPVGAPVIMKALSVQAVALISRSLPLPLIIMPVILTDPMQMLQPQEPV